MAAYGIMKALEWGFVVDRTPYVWTGLDSDLDVDLVGDGKEKTPLRKDPERLRAIQAKNAASDSRLDILVKIGRASCRERVS